MTGAEAPARAFDGRAVLVTGATGFVGRHVVDAFRSQGAEVTGLARGSGQRPSPVRIRCGDLVEPGFASLAVRASRPEIVVHLAATMTPRSDRSDGLGGYADTVIATDALIAAVAEIAPAARLVVLSSSAVYGDQGAVLVSEDALVRPMTAYGVSKAAQELVALRARWAGELDVVVARSFNLVGPGMPPRLLLGSVARQLVQATGDSPIVEVGNLAPRRDYLDVRDLADALTRIVEIAHPPALLNVAVGRSWSAAEVVDLLVSVSGRPAVVRQAHARMRQTDIADQVGDSARLARLTGWRPRIELATSLVDLLEDLRSGDSKEKP